MGTTNYRLQSHFSAGIYFVCAITYYEVLFHILLVGTIDTSLLFKILCSVSNGFLIVLFLRLLA